MTRVYIVQHLCPKRHCILASAFECEPLQKEARAKQAIDSLKEMWRKAEAEQLLNPWCDICHAPLAECRYEVALTKYRTLEEAKPHLQQIEKEQLETNARIRAERERAARN